MCKRKSSARTSRKRLDWDGFKRTIWPVPMDSEVEKRHALGSAAGAKSSMSRLYFLNRLSWVVRVPPVIPPNLLKHLEAERTLDYNSRLEAVLVPTPGLLAPDGTGAIRSDYCCQLVVLKDGPQHVEPRVVLGVVGNVPEGGDGREDG